VIRLHLVVEGQTEETFVRDVLGPELGRHSIAADVHRIATGRRRDRSFRGGFVKYDHLRNDLTLWMKQDQREDAWFSTMVDLYRMPPDFPGWERSRTIPDPVERVSFLEKEFLSAMEHRRFVPYIQLHEFEALLFADPGKFLVSFPDAKREVAELESIRRGVPTPEHIDDGEDSAPSKRVCALIPDYAKPANGPVIAAAIGLPKIRRECPHFGEWFERLLGLV
jgi:Domain of unknown function (DUF4276)